MNPVAVAKKKIRRALMLGVYDAMVAANIMMPAEPGQVPQPAIDFGNDGFLRDNLPRYVRFGVIWGNVEPKTWGETPRLEANGSLEISAFTPWEEGEDANDALLAIALSPYVWNAEFAFDGIRVTIWETEPRNGSRDGAWRFCPMIVNWKVMRTE